MYTSLSYIICIAIVFDDHRSCQKLINYITNIKAKSKRHHWIQKIPVLNTAGNRHKQNSRFCKEIREDNFRFWWRRVHEDASLGMYMSKIEICFFTARILQNQRMLCCGECFHD